jgi:hypothetical protein
MATGAPQWNVLEYAVSPPSPEPTTRLPRLLPGGRYDHWWTVSQSVDLDALAGEVVSAVSDYGLPWLRGEISRAEQNVRPSAETSPEDKRS